MDIEEVILLVEHRTLLVLMLLLRLSRLEPLHLPSFTYYYDYEYPFTPKFGQMPLQPPPLVILNPVVRDSSNSSLRVAYHPTQHCVLSRKFTDLEDPRTPGPPSTWP